MTDHSICGRRTPRLVVISMLLVCCAFVSTVASAVTVTIGPVADTTIYQGVDPVTSENFEVNSCGAGSNLFMGNTNDGLQRRSRLPATGGLLESPGQEHV
mgnify:CR=1 FL=1